MNAALPAAVHRLLDQKRELVAYQEHLQREGQGSPFKAFWAASSIRLIDQIVELAESLAPEDLVPLHPIVAVAEPLRCALPQEPLSRRDQFALAAMQGLLTADGRWIDRDDPNQITVLVRGVVAIADAMLRELDRPVEQPVEEPESPAPAAGNTTTAIPEVTC